MTRPVVIVDPVSSGSELAPAFAERKVPAIAVRSSVGSGSDAAGYAKSVRSADFLAVYEYGPDLIDRLRRLNPLAIIPGCERAVPLADSLSVTLTPYLANVPALSQARRHKGAMQEALANAGLPVIRTLSTSSADEVNVWLTEHKLKHVALVVKPPISAGSDNVFHVPPGGDWRRAFDYILSTPSALSRELNETVIVQEQVTGMEFAVDSVSADGQHVLAHLIRYSKASAGERMTVFDHTEFVPFEPDQHSELLDYAWRALDALGIRWGAAHSEIMLTRSGPRLIETGARMCGGPVLGFARTATGCSQLERIVEAYVDGEVLTRNYELRRTVVPVFLISPASGLLRNGEILDQLRTLPTHLETHLWVDNHGHVRRTLDFNTAMGVVALAGKRDAVFADYARIRDVESRLVIESD